MQTRLRTVTFFNYYMFFITSLTLLDRGFGCEGSRLVGRTILIYTSNVDGVVLAGHKGHVLGGSDSHLFSLRHRNLDDREANAGNVTMEGSGSIHAFLTPQSFLTP